MSESSIETRLEQRFKLAFRAIVTDKNGLIELSCLVRDGSASGCRLVSSQVDILPRDILLRVKGLSEPIPGRVMWRTKKMAGVKFNWERLASQDSRRAKRHDTSIRVKVTAEGGQESFDGMIVDASVSGARLLSANIDRIPDAVVIHVDGVAAPIPGRIVWRKKNEAGVALKFPQVNANPRRRRKQKDVSAPADAEDVVDLNADDIIMIDS